MVDTATTAKGIESWAKQALANEQGRKVIGEQMKRIWGSEDKLVGDIHDYMEGWCERRHAAAKAAMEYANLMANGAEQEEISKAWSKLSSNSMKRFSEDTQAQLGLMQKMAVAMMPGMGEGRLPMFSPFGVPSAPGEDASEASSDKKPSKD